LFQRPRVVRFGAFELDLRSGELHKQGRKIRLEGQPVHILIYLLENPGELITREQLHRRLWPADTFVNFEHGLNAAIKRLRRALDDSADNPRFVETLPRRGYRFIAPVQGGAQGQASSSTVEGQLGAHASAASAPEVTNADVSSPKTAVRRGSRQTLAWILSSVAVLLLAGWLILWRQSENRSTSVIGSLAVLPLASLSADTSQEYFSDGMTDELIAELGQIGGLQVISRTSIMTYKGTHKSLPQIARELKVDAVVEGTVLRSGQQVRITAQLIEAATDKHLWSQSYERDIRDTLALQKEVARSIAGQIQIALTPREQAVLKNSHRVNPEAYEAYLRGRYFGTSEPPRDSRRPSNISPRRPSETPRMHPHILDWPTPMRYRGIGSMEFWRPRRRTRKPKRLRRELLHWTILWVKPTSRSHSRYRILTGIGRMPAANFSAELS
jgi:TolB-like protein/DNA-binding winged helix-turn-helix (wHTH) protein